MPTPIATQGPLQTLSRLKWTAQIRVSPDTSDILGFPQALNAAVALSGSSPSPSKFSALIASTSQLCGSIESIELTQNRGLIERFGFNDNSPEAFQVVPTQFTKTLRMTKTLVHALGIAEKVFSFAPNNLAFQQNPFIIHLREPGVSGGSGIDYFFFNCWFSDSLVKYDVTEKDNVKLMQNTNIKFGRMLVLDDTDAGGAGSLLLQGIFGGILAIDDVQNLIDNMDLT